jgi:hypothetical protein
MKGTNGEGRLVNPERRGTKGTNGRRNKGTKERTNEGREVTKAGRKEGRKDEDWSIFFGSLERGREEDTKERKSKGTNEQKKQED